MKYLQRIYDACDEAALALPTPPRTPSSSTSTDDYAAHGTWPSKRPRIAHSKNKTAIVKPKISTTSQPHQTAAAKVSAQRKVCGPSPTKTLVSKFVTWDVANIRNNSSLIALKYFRNVEFWFMCVFIFIFRTLSMEINFVFRINQNH